MTQAPFIIRIFGGGTPTTHRPTWQRVTAALLLGAMAAAAVWLYNDRYAPSPARAKLVAMAERLIDAQSRGDHVAATRLYDEAGTLLRDLNDRAGAGGAGAAHNCRLAAMHLVHGLVSVGDGGPWLRRDEFDATLRLCR